MRIYDVEGGLIYLGNKDIELQLGFRFDDYGARVVATSGGEYETRSSYVLHRGTVAECRDYMSLLAEQIGPIIRIDGVSSTKIPVEPKPVQKESDCPF